MTDQPPTTPLPAAPDDLPGDGDFGPGFGLEPPANLDLPLPGSDWVPDQVGVPSQAYGATGAYSPDGTGAPGEPSADYAHVPGQPPEHDLQSVPPAGPPAAGPPAAGRAAMGRSGARPTAPDVRGWVVAAVLAAVFVPLFVWFALSLSDDGVESLTPGPQAARPSATATPKASRPSATASRATPPRASRITPTRPASGPALVSPPPLTAVPPQPLTPVKPGAKVMRFEAHGPKGQLLEVALTDAQHQRFEYPVQAGPLGFELPVRATSSSSDYYSIRVRAPSSSGSDTRVDVMCRIYVDGVLVTSQQGQGYATCYISPYYDVRRT